MTSAQPIPPPALTETELRDLGFGRVVSEQSRQRLLNPDGTFNVRRTGLRFRSSFSIYHAFLTMPWWEYFSILFVSYLAANMAFAGAYLLCGPGALSGPGVESFGGPFWRAFFFSVQTSATIGYGQIHPVGLPANLIVTAESLISLLSFALATGLLFARFSRPNVHILFSRNALIAPYRDLRSFQFRIANARSSQIIELEATVLFTRFEPDGERRMRRYYLLPLERPKVVFFPLSWTVVHPINESSPLYGLTSRDLEEGDAEFLVLLTGIDETFSQTVHTRTSYVAEDIVWNARFANIFRQEQSGTLEVAVDRIHEYERLS